MANELKAMIGATCVCFSLKNDSSITYQLASQRNYYATNIRTYYRQSGVRSWTLYNEDDVLGRPERTEDGSGSGTEITYYEPLWRNPHWFHNRWRWHLTGLNTSTTYEIKVCIMNGTTIAKTITISVTTDLYEQIPYVVDTSLTSAQQQSVRDAIGILDLYFVASGLKGYALQNCGAGGLYFTYNPNQSGAASATEYGQVILGVRGLTDFKNSFFSTYCHELCHFFGVENNSNVSGVDGRVNYFTSTNNSLYFSATADPIENPDKAHVVGSTNRYDYSESCLDEVFEFCQGVDNARVVRFIDHCNISEATNNLLDVFFLFRALHFEDVTIVSGTLTTATEYILTFTGDDHCSCSPEIFIGANTDQVSVTVTCDSGYTFDSWDDGSIDNPRTFTIQASSDDYLAFSA